MSTTTALSESNVLLHGITWETFDRLADELENRAVQLTYDRGSLEIMTPSHRHETDKKLVGRMIEAMTEEPDAGAGPPS